MAGELRFLLDMVRYFSTDMRVAMVCMMGTQSY